jgi:nicotinate-nucleotide adenylyltransferase
MIGILGGTFDPVHYGHLRAAIEVRDSLHLDHVRLIPNACPPHRRQPIASAARRAAMVELAIAGRPGLICDTCELERAGQSYMIDTLRLLRVQFPMRSLLLLIGTDAFCSLAEWHQWLQLFDYAHIVVMTRPGYAVALAQDFLKSVWVSDPAQLRQSPAGYLYFQPITQLDISATVIRTLLTSEKSVDFLLPDSVLAYAKKHRLYQIE